MSICFFCLEAVYRKSQATDIHHVIFKRYFKPFPGEDPNYGNTVRVHVLCHRKAHAEFDNPLMPLDNYVPYMESLDWLYGIFASPDKRRGYLFAHKLGC